jgi:hypothetical protein
LKAAPKTFLYKLAYKSDMAGIIGVIRSIFDRLIPESARFSRLRLAPGAIEDILEFARAAHPHEFLAALEGKVDDGTLTITGLSDWLCAQPPVRKQHSLKG